jgi:hypothetical protein
VVQDKDQWRGCCEHDDKPLGFMNGNVKLVAELLAPQESLRLTDLVSSPYSLVKLTAWVIVVGN